MKPVQFLRFCLVVAALLPVTVQALAREDDAANPDRVHIPADAGLVNVREHGLRGDGTTDDTDALLRIVRSSLDRHKTLFFPEGTYLLSDSVPWATASAHSCAAWVVWRDRVRFDILDSVVTIS